MTKEEYDASPKRICLLCSLNILDSNGGSYWEDYLIRHLLDSHNLGSFVVTDEVTLAEDDGLYNPYRVWKWYGQEAGYNEPLRTELLTENFTDPF